MEKSANAGCSLCAQFSQGSIENCIENLSERWRKRRHALEEYERRFEEGGKLPSGIVHIRPGWYNGKYDRETTFWSLNLSFELPEDFWKADRSDFPLSYLPGEESFVYMISTGARGKSWLYTLVMVNFIYTYYLSAEDDAPPLQKQGAPSSEDSLPIIKKWFERCCNSHSKCNIRQRSFRPTRLLYIGDDVPRLRLSANYEAGVKYATLSHSWGHISLATLHAGTLQQFRTEIPVEAISKTFKDAICVAKTLDIQYIWIDSLCILQNDSDDWKKESSLIYCVYSNSTINIAASDAIDGTQGCFFKRRQTWRCQIQGLCAQEELIYECVPPEKHIRDMASPLESRGWRYQERYLAPRTLYFTEREVYWECHHTNACETFPAGFPPRLLPIWTGNLTDLRRIYQKNCGNDRYGGIHGASRHSIQQR
jgi:Heterokaryon incompatibility protein (HET)